MTQERQLERNYFQLNMGLNTESNEINWPDGYTIDEANYELLRDGSRRRRKGLALENGGGADLQTAPLNQTERVQTYIWRNVGGNPDLDFYVLRIGDNLYFAQADEVVSDGWLTGAGRSIALDGFYNDQATAGTTTNAPVTFSQGRGRLLVSGQYIFPFYVKYDGTDQCQAVRINIRIRDFSTIDDGIGVDKEPSVLSDEHNYNLLNRGWPSTELQLYNTTHGRYPARNMVWHKGYRKQVDASYADADGIRTWDENKVSAEGFGQSSAPVGALFLDPTDTRQARTVAEAISGGAIEDWTFTEPPGGGDWTITITKTGHGLSPGAEFTIDGNVFSMRVSYSRTKTGYEEYEYENLIDTSLDGQWEVDTVVNANTFTFIWANTPPGSWVAWRNQYTALGSIGSAGQSLERTTGTAHPDSWQAVAWFAGRAWYGGMLNDEFNDYIMFSQIVSSPEKYGKCYQEQDPTDEFFSDLEATDGGAIVIPGMGGVIGMESLRDSLIIFGRDGVWAIETGQGGFTPTNFRVRKLSEAGASSVDGILRIEDSMIYTGTGGVYIIAPNQYTGLLEVNNAIRETIQSLWSAIPTEQQERVQTIYDDAQRRVYFLYGATAADYSMYNMLIFALDQAAWFKYTFPQGGLLTGGAIPSADDPTNNKKMKFVYQADTQEVNIADFDQTTFVDFNGQPSPAPYMYTGWDNLGNHQVRRQAPLITVFNKRTETGFTANEDLSYSPVNESSTTMTAYWDWTSDAANEQTTGKIGDGQEVYRHQRTFVPGSEVDLDGYPVVITRNKVRGRGRALQLKFEGSGTKDSHILGFTINYKLTRRK